MHKITHILAYLLVSLIVFTNQSELNELPNAEGEVVQEERKDFQSSLFYSFTLIFVSEIGDKTFFLVMIYAMSNNWLKTLLVTSAAMLLMNAVSVTVGYVLPFLIYKIYIYWIAVFLFLFFSIHMFIAAFKKENRLVEEQFRKKVKKLEKRKYSSEDIEDRERKLSEPLLREKEKEKDELFSGVFPFIVTMIVGEMGDNSQIATVVMGAVQNYWGVLIGGSVAHVLAILVAIFLGNILVKHLTTRQIHLAGGTMFLLFAISYLLEIFQIKLL